MPRWLRSRSRRRRFPEVDVALEGIGYQPTEFRIHHIVVRWYFQDCVHVLNQRGKLAYQTSIKQVVVEIKRLCAPTDELLALHQEGEKVGISVAVTRSHAMELKVSPVDPAIGESETFVERRIQPCMFG